MNLSRSLCCLTLSILLTACGGGGGDNDSGPDAPSVLVNLADFEGAWLVRPDIADCQANFAYNASYFYRFKSVTIINTGVILQATVAADLFDDATCSTRRGLIEEQFLIDATPRMSAGRSNVIKATFTFTASRSSADGGSGVSINQIPDGSFSGLLNRKYLADREGERLYLTDGAKSQALDGEGYPAGIDPDEYLIREMTKN